ncbi:MAG TPA: Mth938-like domain-containing protein [Methylibium sp.]|jgi:uncharacterized protein|nr:Mth938-like domain-containing protein [Methylibium sp.]
MKLQPDRIAAANVIGGYNAASVDIGGRDWTESLLLPWAGEVQAWDGASFDTLSAAHFERAAGLGPELVLFGSGRRLRFPRPEWLRPLIERRIGIETMDTRAACRTYNLLVAEGRSVVAALLLEREG